ncbi:hypothetical protein LCI18_015234 [Fusarium solani-melongenae]|uniref:Uncharacterized protein n=1 Tax=Fusarium solani subsp. cucurbitae TaxID=2747967 RepID=A0ACD3ZSQ0_FUSSC|nr:hypothetical protein LCI18_015234 [Fusarium solani-melongenae]
MAEYDTIPAAAQLQIERFQLRISEEKVDEFERLLHLSKLAPKTYESLQPDGKFGITHDWISKAKEYWENNYDWRQREDYINSFPNFIANVQDDDGENFRIHFAALFSRREDAIPLLLLHGWPAGNHLEFLKVIELLRQKYSPEDLPYHVIVPSLPGYTLSSGPPLTKDWSTEDIGRLMNKLMIGLGFGSGYISQGGDIGAFVSWILAVNHKECHVNFAIGQEPEGVSQSDISDAERQGLQRLQKFLTSGFAYFQEHTTRPATIGHVLSSSSLALLSWMGEKFIEWTDTTPDYEEILDSVTLYWFTESIARGLYPYRTPYGTPGLHPPLSDPKYYCKKPLGYSSFPYELGPTPAAWLRKEGNLVWHRLHTKGGHFAAMEQPELFLGDVEEFIRHVWPVE